MASRAVAATVRRQRGGGSPTGVNRGPVVFYTARITPERTEAATALGAEICNSPQVLLSALAGARRVAVEAGTGGVVIAGDRIVQTAAGYPVDVRSLGGQPRRPEPRPPPVIVLPRRPTTPLIGREAELAAATTALRERHHVQIIGEPGSGKTSLVRRLTYEPAFRPPHGMVFANARGLSLDDLTLMLFESLYSVDALYRPTAGETRVLLRDVEVLVCFDDLQAENTDVHSLFDITPRSVFVLAPVEPYLLDPSSSVSIDLRGLPRAAAFELLEQQLGRTLTPEERRAASRWLSRRAASH